MSRRCGSRERELLDWYVNGTLKVADEAAVREHTARCGPCRQEVEELSELAASMRVYSGMPAMTARVPWWRSLGMWSGVAALLVVAVSMMLLHRPEPEVFVMDLGRGTLRGDTAPVEWVLPARSASVELRFKTPATVRPTACTWTLEAPSGRLVLEDTPIETSGPVVRTLPAAMFREPGEYRLTIHERTREGGLRHYPYVFSLRPSSRS